MAHGYTFNVVGPPTYQRVIDGFANLVLVPLSWLNVLLSGAPPASRDGPFYRVEVENKRGKRRSIAIVSSFTEAIRIQQRSAARLEELGVAAWAKEMPIPRAFFDR